MPGFFERRALRKFATAEARAAAPRLKALEERVLTAQRRVVERYSDLPGFPPICARCERPMRYERVQLSQKKWRWMWCCPSCSNRVYDAAVKRSSGPVHG